MGLVVPQSSGWEGGKAAAAAAAGEGGKVGKKVGKPTTQPGAGKKKTSGGEGEIYLD